jgi:hypothetical protein
MPNNRKIPTQDEQWFPCYVVQNDQVFQLCQRMHNQHCPQSQSTLLPSPIQKMLFNQQIHDYHYKVRHIIMYYVQTILKWHA